MKKVLLTIYISVLMCCLCGCEKEVLPAVYTISCTEELGYTQTYMVFECNEYGDKIFDRRISPVKKGVNYKYTATSTDVIKLKIYISYESMFSSGHKWVQRVYYLDNNKENKIIINESTILGPNEP